MVLAQRITAALVLAVAAAGCSTIPADGTARGEVLYKNCVPCHGTDGHGKPEITVPQIAGLPVWYVTAQLNAYKSGMRGAHGKDQEGLRMRPMSRTLKTTNDVEAVAAYVAAMPHSRDAASVQGDVAKGQAAFATCSACHGADGKGNETLKAPPIAQLQDWYVVKQLGKFKGGIRAYDPADASGAQMKAIAGGVADEAAMMDLAAYLQTLPAN